MDLQLKESVVAVVGGARGIGAAVLDRLVQEGARAVCIDLFPEKDLGTGGPRPVADGGGCGWRLHGDVTRPESLAACRRRIESEWGPLSGLVVAAGCGSGKYGYPFWNLEPGDWRRVLEVNLLGVVHCLHEFCPAMRERRRGSVVLFASVAAHIGSPTDPPYSAAKAGVVNFAQGAAKDLAPYDVRVNVISPGMVRTALNRSVYEAWRALRQAEGATVDSLPSYEQWGDEKVARTTPLGRWQTPDDMAVAALFLLSPLSRNVTGQTLHVNGGQFM